MSERQGDTAKFRQELDKHITRSDEPAPMSERINKAEVARLRELERQAKALRNLADEIETSDEEHPFGADWVRRKAEENERGFGRKS